MAMRDGPDNGRSDPDSAAAVAGKSAAVRAVAASACRDARVSWLSLAAPGIPDRDGSDARWVVVPIITAAPGAADGGELGMPAAAAAVLSASAVSPLDKEALPDAPGGELGTDATAASTVG
jgi:hypothetical protein